MDHAPGHTNGAGWPGATHGGLWKMIDGVAQQEDIGVEQYSLIESQLERCADSFEVRRFFSIGYPVRQHHDNEILKLNRTYWKSQAGS